LITKKFSEDDVDKFICASNITSKLVNTRQ
jgi:hypothetical protein